MINQFENAETEAEIVCDLTLKEAEIIGPLSVFLELYMLAM